MTNGLTTRLLTKPQAQFLVDAINQGAVDVREKLMQLRNGEGWRALGFKSWDDCVEAVFVFSRRHANRQLVAADIEQRLGPIGLSATHGSHFMLPESHARELAAVPEKRQLEVYRRALETSPNGLTAEHIRKTIVAMGLRRVKNIFDDEAAGPTMRRFQSSGIHETPDEFISAVEGRFDLIELDLAALARNAVVDRFISPKEDALKQDWTRLLKGKFGYLNPPFDPVGPWSEKSAAEAKTGAPFGLLTQGSIDADWFWRFFPMAAVFALTPRITFVGERDPFPKPLIFSVFNMVGRGVRSGEVGRISRWHWKEENDPNRARKRSRAEYRVK